MIYIVSGMPRSGTSMMMRCLVNSGIAGKYTDCYEHLNDIFGTVDYKPNPRGFYALHAEQTDWKNLPLSEFENHVFKIPFEYIKDLPAGNYKMIFMKRNPIEIKKSMDSFTPRNNWGYDDLLNNYERWVSNFIAEVKAKGIEVLEINYLDIINSPLAEFTKIRLFGINIDPIQASSYVEPELYRSKS